MLSATFVLGYDVQGNLADIAGSGGLVRDGHIPVPIYINPSRSLWRQTGAPFGSPQTVHSVASGSLPPGVMICQGAAGFLNVGEVNNFGLKGIPTATGVYTGTFAASGAFLGDSFTITITRFGSCPIISLTPATLPQVSAGYSQALTPSGGTGPFAYSVISGALPPGISLSSAGVFSGDPTALGYYTVVVRMIDSAGCTAVQTFWLAVVMVLTEVVPNAGPWEGGTPVELHGINLFGVTTVQFGLQEATSVVVVSAGVVTCVTPESGTGGAVVFVGLNGIASSVPFTYTAKVSKEFDIRRDPDITIEAQRNDAPSTAQFTVANEEPLVGTYTRIWDPASRKKMHAGTVMRTTQVYREGDLAWASSTKDDSWLLDRRRPFGIYAHHDPGALPEDDGIPADEVALDILTKYTSGFTFNRVFAGLPKITISFDGTQPLSACLTAICQAAAKSPDAKGGLVWNCDERDILLGYDTGTIEVEDKFSGDGTLIARDQFTGDGATVTFNLSAPAEGFPDFLAMVTEQYIDPANVVFYYNANTYREGRLGRKSPAQIPTAPVLTTVPGSWIPTPPDPTNPYNFRSMVMRIAFLFDDGTESFVGPRSAIVNIPRADGWTVTIPLGGAGVIGRRIYMSMFPGNSLNIRRFVMDVTDNVTMVVTARGDGNTLVDYSNVSPVFAGSSTNLGINNDALGSEGVFYPSGFPFVNGLDGEQSVTWQYDPATNSVTKGAPILDYDVVTETFIEPANPTPAPSGTAHWNINIGYVTSNPAATNLFALKHDLVLSPITGLIGPGYVSYNNGLGSFNEPITATGGGGSWTYDSITNSITRELGPPVTGVNNIVFKYWTGVGVAQLDLNDTLLIRDPPPSKTIELSQVRNRIHVLGVGTTTRTYAFAGPGGVATEKSDMFLIGGKVRIGEDVYTISTLSYDPTNPYIIFTTSMLRDYPPGTEVRTYHVFDDVPAQEMLAEREDEGNGDGIHETTLSFTGWLISSTIYDVPAGTRAAAESNALASRGIVELATWAWPVESLTFATRDVNIKSGAMITWDLLDPPIVGVFKVQSVSIDQIDLMYEDQLVAYEPRFTCKASMVRFEFSDLLRKVLISDSGGGGNSSSSGFGGSGGGTGGGGGGGTTLIPEFWGEVPAGAVDGVNDIFTLPHAYRPGNLAVYENGVRQVIGQDFTETSDSSFTMVNPPKAGGRIVTDSRGY